MQRSILSAALLSLVFLLCVSCLTGGGGGGGGSASAKDESQISQDTVATPSDLLAANAGPDQTVVQGEYVTLDGSESTGNAPPLTYTWTVAQAPLRSTAAPTADNTVSTTFTPDLVGDYTLRLVVTDSSGQNSQPDDVIIQVLPISQATQVTLAWDASEQGVEGYKVYYGTSSRDYQYVKDVGSVTAFTLASLADGVRYYFAVTAYAGSTESEFSNEVSFIGSGPG